MAGHVQVAGPAHEPDQEVFVPEAVYRRKDGSLVQVEIHAHSIVYRGREARLALVEDITSRRQAEEALRRSEAQFRAMADASPAGVVLTDRHGRLRYINKATLAMMGLTVEPTIGADVMKVMHPDDRHRVTNEWLAAARAKMPFVSAGRFLRFDGQLTWWRARSSPIESDGRTVGHVIVVVDETEHKTAEAALKESEERFRQLAENIPGVVYLLNPSRGGGMLFISQAYETIWGRPRQTIYENPRAFLDAVHDDDRARVVEAYEKRLSKLDIEYRIVRPDGEITWVQDLQFPIRRADGAISLIAGLAFDSTQRHRLEDQLLQAQKMESLGRLAGGVAHDFNNLLTVIMSYADLLKESVDDVDTLQMGLAEIEAASQRAASLTRQLLTFARRQVFSPTTIDLNKLAAAMERMLTHLIGEDIRVELTLGAMRPDVRADPHQIEQVIINLAVNARAAMHQGGVLRIETANVHVAPSPEASAVPPGEYVTLVVADTGVGIPKELQTKIFEPFFTTRPKGEGTGLGLSTSYGIIAQFGGHIRLASEVGRGTTVSCYLPRNAESNGVVVAPAAAPAAKHQGTETVLVVEDEPMVRDVAKRTLERRGYRVLTASNGMEGLRIASDAGDSIDLVVTDVVMPQMGGFELAERLRVCRPTLRVLFTSGYNEEFAIGGGKLAEGIEFLPKPYLPGALLEHVRQVLDQKDPAP